MLERHIGARAYDCCVLIFRRPEERRSAFGLRASAGIANSANSTKHQYRRHSIAYRKSGMRFARSWSDWLRSVVGVLRRFNLLVVCTNSAGLGLFQHTFGGKPEVPPRPWQAGRESSTALAAARALRLTQQRRTPGGVMCRTPAPGAGARLEGRLGPATSAPLTAERTDR